MFYKKQLGQHFLKDQEILNLLVEQIQPQKGEKIIEIGPGGGVLTEKLLAKDVDLTSIEVDDDLIPVLKNRFSNYPHFHLIHQSILKYNLEEKEPYKLVGNLPYNLTTKLFENLLKWPVLPFHMVFLVQHEVAEKMVAYKDKLSPLSICISLLGKATLVKKVFPNAFNPPPKVNSAIVTIDGNLKKEVKDPWVLYDFSHKIFRMPRKTLLNNLLGLMEKSKALELIQKVNLDPMMRPEHLSFEEMEKIFDIWKKESL